MKLAYPAAICLTLILCACGPKPAAPWTGYAEGEMLYVAAPVAGRLSEIRVGIGDAVGPDQPLFRLEASLEKAAEAEAMARAESARLQAQNSDKGRREEELAITEAQLRQARSQLLLAQAELTRRQALVAQNFVSRASTEDAQLLARQAESRVAELEAALKTARLPARDDERQGARALASAAVSLAEQSGWRLRETVQNAPTAGRVQDVFFQTGEWVGAGQAVLALLPSAKRRARFFVSEADLGALKLQQAVTLSCDGCGAAIAARVSFISAQAEYTPPVIYSNAQRAKLVFMIEALPERAADAERLHPGQPLDVRPL